MADIDDSRPPYRPPPQQRQDPSFGSFMTAGLGCCCSGCIAFFGIIFLIVGSFALYFPGLGAMSMVIGLICIVVGCWSSKYTINYARTAS
ncbi:MAG: hypothetical protein RTU30_06480 [Candidatus Thorarchaeota archaeon]